MKKYFVVLLVIFSLLSCMSAPQTREEYIEILKKGGDTYYRVETYKISRKFEDIVTDLKIRAQKCLNKETENTIHGTYGDEVNYSIYSATVKIIDSDKAEFTYLLWQGYPKPQNVPVKGFYISAVDIYRVSALETKVIIYGVSYQRYNDIFEAVKAWCEGKNAPCPPLP